jgi:hypothetical protein
MPSKTGGHRGAVRPMAGRRMWRRPTADRLAVPLKPRRTRSARLAWREWRSFLPLLPRPPSSAVRPGTARRPPDHRPRQQRQIGAPTVLDQGSSGSGPRTAVDERQRAALPALDQRRPLDRSVMRVPGSVGCFAAGKVVGQHQPRPWDRPGFFRPLDPPVRRRSAPGGTTALRRSGLGIASILGTGDPGLTVGSDVDALRGVTDHQRRRCAGRGQFPSMYNSKRLSAVSTAAKWHQRPTTRSSAATVAVRSLARTVKCGRPCSRYSV